MDVSEAIKWKKEVAKKPIKFICLNLFKYEVQNKLRCKTK